MNEIQSLLIVANIQLKGYMSLAAKVGEMICKKVKEDKGWDCKSTLGGQEAGPDLISIIVNSGPHCFGDMMDEEIRWGKLMDGMSLYVEFRAGNREIMDKICEVHK